MRPVMVACRRSTLTVPVDDTHSHSHTPHTPSLPLHLSARHTVIHMYCVGVLGIHIEMFYYKDPHTRTCMCVCVCVTQKRCSVCGLVGGLNCHRHLYPTVCVCVCAIECMSRQLISRVCTHSSGCASDHSRRVHQRRERVKLIEHSSNSVRARVVAGSPTLGGIVIARALLVCIVCMCMCLCVCVCFTYYVMKAFE
jgi:hypothetical protein